MGFTAGNLGVNNQKEISKEILVDDFSVYE